MDIAIHCALGLPWNGNDVKQGPVVYLAGEGMDGLARRVCALKKGKKIETSKAPFYFSKHAVNFYNKESAKKISEAIDRLYKEPPSLIVIDTLARNFGPGDENSTSDMGQFIEHVDKLIRDKFKCCVLMVHHTGHKEKNRIRGSTALRGGVDFEYRIEKQKKLSVKMVCTKMKDGPEPDDTWFEGESILLDMVENQEVTSLVFFKTEAEIKKETKPDLKNERHQKIMNVFYGKSEEGRLNKDQFKYYLSEKNLIKDSADFRNILRRFKAKNLLKSDKNDLILVDEFTI